MQNVVEAGETKGIVGAGAKHSPTTFPTRKIASTAHRTAGVSANERGDRHVTTVVSRRPKPAHEIGIWLGSMGPRMLRLTGELAGGWVAPIPSYLPYERWGDSRERIDAGAEEVGRDPSEILRIVNIPGAITGGGGSRPRSSDPLVGLSGFWAEVLAQWALEFRFDAFVFWPAEDPERQTRRFGEEVVPAVREAVEYLHSSSERSVG